MNELETVRITNPTSTDFTHRFNGQPFTIKAGESKEFSKMVAFHLAKHLSTKMITEEAEKRMTKKDRETPNAAVHLEIAQLATYDTHQRRIALYEILGDTNLVVEVIRAYPFKGFIGDMSLYEDFVKKSREKNEGDGGKE